MRRPSPVVTTHTRAPLVVAAFRQALALRGVGVAAVAAVAHVRPADVRRWLRGAEALPVARLLYVAHFLSTTGRPVAGAVLRHAVVAEAFGGSSIFRPVLRDRYRAAVRASLAGRA